jgi:hypothetical protein
VVAPEPTSQRSRVREPPHDNMGPASLRGGAKGSTIGTEPRVSMGDHFLGRQSQESHHGCRAMWNMRFHHSEGGILEPVCKCYLIFWSWCCGYMASRVPTARVALRMQQKIFAPRVKLYILLYLLPCTLANHHTHHFRAS